VSATTIHAELERVRAASPDGMLHPADVVKFAKNPKTHLHHRFCWDDTLAAKRYRLWQAREVIAAVVTVLPRANQAIEAYVSLRSDRMNGGYRAVSDVMQNDGLRAVMLQEALGELERMRHKYERLVELQPVFEALEKVGKRA
jgi:hypothetical protein